MSRTPRVMIHRMRAEEWTFSLSENYAYFDATQLALDHDIDLIGWTKCPQTKTVLEYLQKQDLLPAYTTHGHFFLLIELIESLLNEKYTSSFTPPIIEDTKGLLVDFKISKARTLMGEDFFYIEADDRESTANGKVAVAAKAYHNAQRRSKLVDRNSYRKVKDILAIITEIGDEYRCRNLGEWHGGNELPYLRAAVAHEVGIRATNYRLLLAMLFIHASQQRYPDL